MPEIGRPQSYSDNATVALHATGKTRLQADSIRRAIVNLLVDNRGKMTLAEIDAKFGFPVRSHVYGLQRFGWVDIEEVKK